MLRPVSGSGDGSFFDCMARKHTEKIKVFEDRILISYKAKTRQKLGDKVLVIW